MNFEELLDEDLSSEMQKLRTTSYTDKEYGNVSDTVVKLMDRKIEMEKLKSEQQFREQQLEEDRKDRLIENAISVAGIVLPLVVTIWGTKVSLKFEEEGTFTTIMGRGFIQKLLPKK
jgi:hypothetical protein